MMSTVERCEGMRNNTVKCKLMIHNLPQALLMGNVGTTILSCDLEAA